MGIRNAAAGLGGLWISAGAFQIVGIVENDPMVGKASLGITAIITGFWFFWYSIRNND